MRQYRITFHLSAEHRLDPFEFAWLLAKHDLEVVAKNEVPMLFVRAKSGSDVTDFCDDVNRTFGPLIFKDVEVAVDHEYVPLDATAST